MSQTPILLFLDIGGPEFIFLVLIALMLYGGRLPEVARNVGRTVGQLKRTADRLAQDFRDQMDEVDDPKPRLPRKPPSKSEPYRDDAGFDPDELREEPLIEEDAASASDESSEDDVPSEEADRDANSAPVSRESTELPDAPPRDA